MKQWDIYTFEFPEGTHPAVILSPDEQCMEPNLPNLNILFAYSLRPTNRPRKRHEVLLDEEDGLDWKTVVRCNKIHLAEKTKLTQLRGHVSPVRQREICRTIAEVFRFRL
jgi:mRNA-degrading endonuclease toxin of MazEF toxin-antitoxin module